MNKLAIILIIAFEVSAENMPTNHPNDDRIKTIVYRANDVIPIQASYKYVTHIDLGKSNKIIDVIIGNMESWMVDITGNEDGVLIKPLTYNDPTNLTLITTNRNYYFELSRSTNKKNYGFVFKYPEDEFKRKKREIENKRRTEVNYDLGLESPSPEDWNFSYVLAGDKESSPVKVFDDGTFMYLNFGKKPIPAIFSVGRDRKESVINYHKSGDYIVIQGMYSQLTLRQGNLTACVFNKKFGLISTPEMNETLETINPQKGE